MGKRIRGGRDHRALTDCKCGTDHRSMSKAAFRLHLRQQAFDALLLDEKKGRTRPGSLKR